jgi:hypothetical protein
MRALSPAPTGHANPSPGQRPGNRAPKHIRALKGRASPCHNPSPGCRFTSFSAPRTANTSCTTRCASPCTVTWPPSFKTWADRPSSSTPSPTTFTFCLNSLARWRSVRPWKRSRRHPQNGSKPRVRSLPGLRGRPGMERSPFQNRMWPPCAITSPPRRSITGRNRFRKNIAPFSAGIAWLSTSGMSGIRTPFQGLVKNVRQFPGRCPGLALISPFRAGETHRLTSTYERKLAALEALKQSLLHQAFTGQL